MVGNRPEVFTAFSCGPASIEMRAEIQITSGKIPGGSCGKLTYRQLREDFFKLTFFLGATARGKVCDGYGRVRDGT